MESAGSLDEKWHWNYLIRLFTDNGLAFSKFLAALAFWSFTRWYSTQVYLRAVEVDRNQAVADAGSHQPIRHRDWASILIKCAPNCTLCLIR